MSGLAGQETTRTSFKMSSTRGGDLRRSALFDTPAVVVAQVFRQI